MSSSAARFEKELKDLNKKFSSLKSDFAQLIKNISMNPTMGTFMGNNCYKIRWAITSKGKGKSGGARVITFVYVEKRIGWCIKRVDLLYLQEKVCNTYKR